ncbi:hypothetical protein FACS1894164_20560 [Spirochaetia bacterium]|nr:hypothetical protein FACS1894164_20560 [Spirochaetia bacterium]
MKLPALTKVPDVLIDKFERAMGQFKSLNLSGKLAFLVGILALVVTVLTGFFSLIFATNAVNTTANKALLDETRLGVIFLDNVINAQLTSLQPMLRNELRKLPGDPIVR